MHQKSCILKKYAHNVLSKLHNVYNIEWSVRIRLTWWTAHEQTDIWSYYHLMTDLEIIVTLASWGLIFIARTYPHGQPYTFLALLLNVAWYPWHVPAQDSRCWACVFFTGDWAPKSVYYYYYKTTNPSSLRSSSPKTKYPQFPEPNASSLIDKKIVWCQNVRSTKGTHMIHYAIWATQQSLLIYPSGWRYSGTCAHEWLSQAHSPE